MSNPNEIAIPFNPRLRIGIDIARVDGVAASLRSFGERYLHRIYRDGEIAYAFAAPSLAAQRLTARFAAKEAAIKAFGWPEAGVSWRDIEVERDSDGACRLALHGHAAHLVRESGCTDIVVSLSHETDHAAAMVAALAPR